MNIRNITAVVPLLFLAQAAFADTGSSAGYDPERFWDEPYPTQFDKSTLAVEQSVIRVDGNRFVDENGETFVFKGVSIADPSKLVTDNRWDRRIFEAVASWGANTIRLPVHPAGWRLRGKGPYLDLIDDAVRWSNELGLYLIIDWHSIGYLPTELYMHNMYVTTRQETLAFWRDIAFRYQGVPTVAVYELFNEPTSMGNTLGRRDWGTWKAELEFMIDMVRARDKDVIPLVAGFNWGYDLRPARDNPIDRPDVAYASHPYPQKERPAERVKESLFAAWDDAWGFIADEHPMILTEIGWVQEDGYGAHIPVIDDGSYGPIIAEYMADKGISYTAWVFDVQWSPRLIDDWDFTPSEQGEFFRQLMLAD